jgi:hypothetical protein
MLQTLIKGPTKCVDARWTWCLHGFLHNIEWIMFHGHLNYSQKSPLGGRPNTKPGDHGTLNSHNRWFILFHHLWGPTWIKIHWNSIWLRARSHVTSHYTRGSATTLHDVGGASGRALDTFFRALTISWSRLLSRVWSAPYFQSRNLKWQIWHGYAICERNETIPDLIRGSKISYLSWKCPQSGHHKCQSENENELRLQNPLNKAKAWPQRAVCPTT